MTEVPRVDAWLGTQPQRILVFRALVLGDMLCMIPALRALRRAYPQANVTLVSLPWAREFVARFPMYFDDFLEFPGFPGLPERVFDVVNFPDFLKTVHHRRFDLALQMHGSGSFVNPLTVMFNARRSAGFYLPGEYCPDAETYLPYPEDVSEVWRHLRLMQHLGIPLDGDELELPVFAKDRSEFEQLPESLLLQDSPYVCIHPGARYLSRRWPAERYAQVGDLLVAEGYRVVITGATSEAPLADAVSQAMTQPHLNLAGKTTLGTLAVLLQGTRLLISNDTGVSHVAAALKVPSVVVVTGSDPQRWAPLNRQLHQLVMRPMECRPCEHRVCPIGFGCAEQVTVQDVADKALEMLSHYRQRAERSSAIAMEHNRSPALRS
jgi:ADP-heptose:LPS heptosyltransferase